MADHQWVKEFPGVVTVCDVEGVILEMNDQAAKSLEADGGRKLIGSNVLDCHPEPSRSQLAEMLKTGQTNVYTVEKQGKKKLVYQTPWYVAGRYAGFMEMVLELPEAMLHIVRAG